MSWEKKLEQFVSFPSLVLEYIVGYGSKRKRTTRRKTKRTR
jgi:hypothetical protein